MLGWRAALVQIRAYLHLSRDEFEARRGVRPNGMLSQHAQWRQLCALLKVHSVFNPWAKPGSSTLPLFEDIHRIVRVDGNNGQVCRPNQRHRLAQHILLQARPKHTGRHTAAQCRVRSGGSSVGGSCSNGNPSEDRRSLCMLEVELHCQISSLVQGLQ